MWGRKVYIAGKISDTPIHIARKKFAEAAKWLDSNGYIPVNPLDLGTSENLTWADNMKICISELVMCDYIVRLPNWTYSPGAFWENEIAMRLKIPVLELPLKIIFLINSY